MWSICRIVPASVAGLFPQYTQRNLSLLNTFTRRFNGIVLVLEVLGAIGLIILTLGELTLRTLLIPLSSVTFSPDLYSINFRQAFVQPPKCR